MDEEKKRRVPELGPLEFRILRQLWRNSPATAGEVLDAYNRKADRKLKYTTVMTLLTRMVEKGVLTVDRTRQPFQFGALVGKDQVLRQRIGEFVEMFFDGRAVDLAVRLVEESSLTEDSILELEETIRRHKRAAEAADRRGRR